MGNAHPNLSPYQPFPCADGMVVIAVGNDGQFRALARALGDEAMATRAGCATNAGRVADRHALGDAISALTRPLAMAKLMARLEAAGVPCGPVNTVDRVFEEAQAKARGLVVEQTRSDLDRPVHTVASPIRLSETPAAYRAPPPALGADTEAVLSELLPDLDVAALRANGVV